MKMKTWLATACAVLVLAACGHQETAQQQPAAEGKVYRVALNAEFAPFEWMNENQEIYGFDIDLMNALAEAGGFKVEFQHKPWDSLFPALAQGDVDMLISAVTITDERKATMDFTEPYYTITQVVLLPKGKHIQSVDDLHKLSKVGVVTGQTGDFAAGKILGETNPKIARFETVALLTKEVENGGVDAAISDSAVIAEYIKNNSDKGFTMIKLDDFDVENYGIAVRKGDKATLDVLNAALKTVRENGKYHEVEGKYFAQ